MGQLYMVSQQIIAVNAKSDIYAMDDLNGKTIAVQSTGKPEEIFLQSGQADIPQFEDIISLEDRSVQYAALDCGYVDAIAAHETAILQYMTGLRRGLPHSGRAAADHRNRRSLFRR
ncbi:MAG: hypothetical protein ACLUEU_12790 [Oscillospiraceae bacterium]